MKVKERTILKIVEHNRGVIEETDNPDFFRLIIDANPENYDYSNWTRIDLKDLAKSINKLLNT